MTFQHGRFVGELILGGQHAFIWNVAGYLVSEVICGDDNDDNHVIIIIIKIIHS